LAAEAAGHKLLYVPFPRSDLLQDLLSLQERMNRLFEASLGPARMESEGLLSPTWSPPADVFETADRFVIQIELPGVDEEEVLVHVDADQVTVRGQRLLKPSTRPECFHRMERSYGPFARTFRLTQEVDPEAVTARFRDGLLQLEAKKARSR
jgi:HSP20 family protein